ncbi:MAG TPA: type I polyketide synthase, partial [Ktedonobacteraceae bacterium]|nr:type I polyketide synthase [Ktedonobacteraceae bacterium]
MDRDEQISNNETFSVAIVGLAGRFPGASDIETFWSNLRDGIEAITFFSDEDLATEISNSATLHDPSIVKAAACLDEIDLFDAAFFGYSPKEADMMDPQHRLFLQCAWQALEHAGYDPETYTGLIGIYGGVGTNLYIRDLLIAGKNSSNLDGLQLTVGNDKDYLTTRVSYKLNLRGPSISIQTACSTSLVAVHLACQALLDYDCDMALAGGVSVRAPQPKMYRYVEGSILSPDGHCRAFDERGQGTIFGNGLGLVVLKRLSDAIEDGDTIYAVIKGTAMNNDGNDKIGYTAPGMQGQRKVIQQAIDVAQIEPETISYIEAHGTGTALGDPIEFSALQQCFSSIKQRQVCALGSVKTNIGHLDTASGIAGLIKTTLALHYKQIPPTLHFHRPNPQIDLEQSPFYINQTLIPWPESPDHPRRAGISSFGIGGTNAHAVLEEAQEPETEKSQRKQHLLLLSARTPEALEQATENMRRHLLAHTEQDLADIAYTNQVGRRAFQFRRALVCCDSESAQTTLATPESLPVLTGEPQFSRSSLCFLFPGQGTQYIGMTRA